MAKPDGATFTNHFIHCFIYRPYTGSNWLKENNQWSIWNKSSVSDQDTNFLPGVGSGARLDFFLNFRPKLWYKKNALNIVIFFRSGSENVNKSLDYKWFGVPDPKRQYWQMSRHLGDNLIRISGNSRGVHRMLGRGGEYTQIWLTDYLV